MFGFTEMSGNMPLMLYLLFKDIVNRKNKHGSHWPYLSECVSHKYHVMKQAGESAKVITGKRTWANRQRCAQYYCNIIFITFTIIAFFFLQYCRNTAHNIQVWMHCVHYVMYYLWWQMCTICHFLVYILDHFFLSKDTLVVREMMQGPVKYKIECI